MKEKYVPIENLQPKFAIFIQDSKSEIKNPYLDTCITKKFTQAEIVDTFTKTKELYFNESEKFGGYCTMWKRLYIAVLAPDSN